MDCKEALKFFSDIVPEAIRSQWRDSYENRIRTYNERIRNNDGMPGVGMLRASD